MTEARVAAQLLVSGWVQMVGYRMWTCRTAKQLGVSGWVRNLDDGRVEIFAEGPASAIDALEAVCGKGPQHAQVEGVARAERSSRGLVDFVQVPDGRAPEPA